MTIDIDTLTPDSGTARRRGAVLVVALAAVVLSAPMFLSAGAYPSGIDTPAHIFKMEVLADMVADHGAVIRWTDQWYTGYPFLTIYSPLSYYAMTLLLFALGDTVLAYNLSRLLLFVGFGTLMFALADREFDERTVSIGVGLLAVTSYPFYNNLFTIGRVPFAAGILLYLTVIYLILDPRLFERSPNRTHLALVAAVTLLIWTHSMMAYLLLYSGVIAAVLYPDRVLNLGVRRITVIVTVVTLLVMPYVVGFITHSRMLDPFWIVWPIHPDLSLHVYRQFGDFLPHYLGAVHAGLLLVGLVGRLYDRSRFAMFVLLNFLFFYLMFWSFNLGLLQFFPFGEQFDLSRFELLFTVYGIFLAGYGLRDVMDIVPAPRRLLLVALVAIAVVDVAPMVGASQNWTPTFEDDIDRVDLNESYRAISVGTRHWDDYILPRRLNLSNTFGWFMQGDPHYNFTRTLQRTDGLWYPTHKDFPTRRSQVLQKNLLWLSNTKYLLFGRDWVPDDAQRYVLGQYDAEHGHNIRMRQNTIQDPEFRLRFNSSGLEIYELSREMSFCEPVTPVGITDDYYRTAVDLLSRPDIEPYVPVRGDIPETPAAVDTNVSCRSTSPTTVTVETAEPAWVLVKESHYPLWRRNDGGQIHEAFGFMVTHVDGTATLTMDERTGRTVR